MPERQLPMHFRGFQFKAIALLTALSPCFAAADESAIRVQPESVSISEPLGSCQLLVDFRDERGNIQDATGRAVFESLNPEVATVSASGFVRGISGGNTEIRVTFDQQVQLVDVRVADPGASRTYDFENDVSPYLTRFGCNMAACHAKTAGPSGLQLSVFGFDPRADFEALVCSSRGRRVSRAAPAHSLFLLKATQSIAHTGGQRMTPDSVAYQALLNWVKAGAPWRDPEAGRIDFLEITPDRRQIALNGTQQLRVEAVFDDGRREDVTRLARYRSNSEGLATVSQDGLVSTNGVPGQVAVMATYLGAVDTFLAYVPQAGSAEPYPDLPSNNLIDRLVHQNLEQLQLLPSGSVSDSDFLRRTYLDIIGTLPTAQEARRFLADRDPHRRKHLVDELLERPEYALYWALKWSDLLRVDRDVLGHRQAYAYYRWIRDSFAVGRPMDEFATAVITASGPLDERPQGNFYQAVTEPGDRASTLSQVFLGIRIDCAECHHHPFDRWSQHDYYGMTAYFTGVSTQTASAGDSLVMEPAMQTLHPRTGEPVAAQPLGAESTIPSTAADPRQDLADWLTADDNPWFARNLANRTWAHFFGHGLVEPVDDVRETNPATNSALLNELAEFLKSRNYDIRSLIRLITESQAYQRSAQPNNTQCIAGAAEAAGRRGSAGCHQSDDRSSRGVRWGSSRNSSHRIMGQQTAASVSETVWATGTEDGL